MTPPKTYGVLLFDDFATLDALGPVGFLNHVPDIQIYLVHDSHLPIPSGTGWPSNDKFSGQLYMPSCTMESAPKLDVLIIPGGAGIRRLREDRRWDEFVARVYPDLQYLFVVCTGATIAARSGVLDGLRATTNKSLFRWVETMGPKVDWIPEARWVVDGNVWTSSGVQAGTDMAYAFVSTVYGETLAKSIADKLEYVPTANASRDPFAAIYNLVTPSNTPSDILPPTPKGFKSEWTVVVYPGFNVLDVVSVTTFTELIGLRPEFPVNVSVAAPRLDVIASGSLSPSGGQHLMPTHSFDESPKDVDVLIVPGLSNVGPFPYQDEITAYIAKTYPHVKHIISIGTGSILLAAAGILNGRKATTSKADFDTATAPFRDDGMNITWTTGRWVRDGNVWTASGTASGLDAANALCTEMFGAAVAQKASVMMEYVPRTKSWEDPFAEVWGVKAA